MAAMKIEDCEPSKATLPDDETPCSTDSDASAGERPAVPEDKRCKYPSKYCGRARVRKTNGTFHRFCQYHRIKANTNQKRWTSVRRQQAAQEDQQRRRAEAFAAVRQSAQVYSGNMVAHGHWVPELLPDPVSLSQSAEPVGLALEDVQILKALFMGDAYEPQGYGVYPSNCHPAVHKPHAFEHFDITL